jgi:hypothetical protein
MRGLDLRVHVIILLLEHDPEKCVADFGRDHAPPRTWSVIASEARVITL